MDYGISREVGVEPKLVIEDPRYGNQYTLATFVAEAEGYPAGTVVARNSSTFQWAKYDAEGSNDLNTARGVVVDPVKESDGATVQNLVMRKGKVYISALDVKTSVVKRQLEDVGIYPIGAAVDGS